MLELSKISTDGGTQTRNELNQETVAEYARGDEVPAPSSRQSSCILTRKTSGSQKDITA